MILSSTLSECFWVKSENIAIMWSPAIYRFLKAGEKFSAGCAIDVLVLNRVSVFVVAIKRRAATSLKCLNCVQPLVLPRVLSSLILSLPAPNDGKSMRNFPHIMRFSKR